MLGDDAGGSVQSALSGSDFDRLLAGLGPVAWDTMVHCRDKASNVPGLLRTWLTSEDPREAKSAGEQVRDALQYQGSIFEPSSHATRLVAAALPLAKSARAQELVTWVAEMARAYTMTEGQGMLHWVKEDDPERTQVEAQYRRELGWVLDVQRAVWLAHRELVRRLRHDDARMPQLQLPYALVGLLVDAAEGHPDGVDLAEAAREVSELVLVRLGATGDDLLRTGYAYTLGRLQQLVPGNTDVLEAQLEKNGDAFTAVAAMFLARSRPGPGVADALARALEARDQHRQWFPMKPYSPWLSGHFRFQLVRTLAYGPLTDADFDRALPALLDLLRTNPIATADFDIGPVLQRVFKGKPLPENATRKNLDARQHAVLQALYDNEELWDPTSGNLTLVMRRIGLDLDRELVGRVLR